MRLVGLPARHPLQPTEPYASLWVLHACGSSSGSTSDAGHPHREARRWAQGPAGSYAEAGQAVVPRRPLTSRGMAGTCQ
jgi:hypothetical protein